MCIPTSFNICFYTCIYASVCMCAYMYMFKLCVQLNHMLCEFYIHNSICTVFCLMCNVQITRNQGIKYMYMLDQVNNLKCALIRMILYPLWLFQITKNGHNHLIKKTYNWQAKRAYLVVQLARDFHIYICIGWCILVPCINCVLAYGACTARELPTRYAQT